MGREGLEGSPGIDGLHGKVGTKGVKVRGLSTVLVMFFSIHDVKTSCDCCSAIVFFMLRGSKETMEKWAYLANQGTWVELV